MRQSGNSPLHEAKTGSDISQELHLIPRWSMLGALIAFALTEYYFLVVLPMHNHHPSALPVALHFYLVLSWGALAAVSMLMMGYISNDAPRRGMSARLWMVCVVMPGGIGAVLYFLLRQPILTSCPSCGTRITGNYHFCPQCAYQVSASCGNCYRTTSITDLFCTHCGHDLASDHRPARLQAFPG
ncbi:double zinc ribbon domain-containing protein [Silvibacterium dinghuense]|uniref:double zinc ribbon domain-containing protein n=1 Tax=Silvibacterium dinghuense TaxID=1560006 RepID=UPI001E5053F3|nr:zinc ribbon domain-containing protein [Silvibacterium dinghuense]